MTAKGLALATLLSEIEAYEGRGRNDTLISSHPDIRTYDGGIRAGVQGDRTQAGAQDDANGDSGWGGSAERKSIWQPMGRPERWEALVGRRNAEGHEEVTRTYPLQPIVQDDEGTIRFLANPVVECIFKAYAPGLLSLLEQFAEDEDALDQFLMLIGHPAKPFMHTTHNGHTRAAVAKIIRRIEDNEDA